MIRLQSFTVGLAVTAVAGCGLFDSRGVAVLGPPPPPDRMQVSAYRAENPFVVGAAGEPYVRSAFSTAEAGYRIEVRDVLVAPAQKLVNVRIGGAAMFEVRDGAGTLVREGKRVALRMGSTFVASDGESIGIEAAGVPMILRVHEFKAR